MNEKCPKCENFTFGFLKDSVDIGVGEQEFIIGGECSICGSLDYCPYCGVWENGDGKLVHLSWCDRRNE